MDVLLLLVGGGLLYLGAEWLVGGASGLALSLRVPQLIVGLTIVAYGTSAPELIVGLQASAAGHGDVALGNIIGSNIANIGLILGISTLVRPALVNGALRRTELPILLVSTIALPVVLFDGTIERWEAGALVLVTIAYTVWMVQRARSAAILADAKERAAVTADATDIGGAPSPGGRVRQVLVALTGLATLLVGGHLFVSGAMAIARAWGMSERVLGLTIVAVGTSLPELATSVIAAARGRSDIALGNVVGSNIFNVFFCLGTAGLVRPIRSSPATLVVDLGVLSGMTLAALVSMRTARTFSRWEGAMLLVAYTAFVGYLTVAGAH